MTTRIQSAGPRVSVQGNHTAARVTPPPTRPFRHVLDAGADAVVTGAESAARQLPGGPILAAAFRPSIGVSEGAVVADGPSTGSSLPEGSSGTAGVGSGLRGGAPAVGEDDQALYYLQLQQQISAESRAYTALSNVLKARHDTVKNAIGNIR